MVCGATRWITSCTVTTFGVFSPTSGNSPVPPQKTSSRSRRASSPALATSHRLFGSRPHRESSTRIDQRSEIGARPGGVGVYKKNSAPGRTRSSPLHNSQMYRPMPLRRGPSRRPSIPIRTGRHNCWFRSLDTPTLTAQWLRRPFGTGLPKLSELRSVGVGSVSGAAFPHRVHMKNSSVSIAYVQARGYQPD